MTNVYRILLGLVLLFGLILLGGTVYGVFFHKGDKALVSFGVPGLQGGSALQSNSGMQDIPGEHVFTGIGRLRLSSAEPEPAMVILGISFPYSPEDRAFSEELAARVNDFRTITIDYFGSLNSEDLRNSNEDELKAELLKRFNRVLRLGNIRSLYFNDFFILD